MLQQALIVCFNLRIESLIIRSPYNRYTWQMGSPIGFNLRIESLIIRSTMFGDADRVAQDRCFNLRIESLIIRSGGSLTRTASAV